jgi:hypothetical protein
VAPGSFADPLMWRRVDFGFLTTGAVVKRSRLLWWSCDGLGIQIENLELVVRAENWLSSGG